MPSLTPTRSIAHSRIGFNGQLHEPATAWQLLGNGHRAYNPVLMRFHSPDRESPFDKGGPNAYAYCGSEPLNHDDPSGQFFKPMLALSLGALAVGGLATARAVVVDDTHDKVVAGLVAASMFALAALAGARAFGMSRHPLPARPLSPTTPRVHAVAARQPGHGQSWGRTSNTSSLDAPPPYPSLARLDDAPPPSYRWATKKERAIPLRDRPGRAHASGAPDGSTRSTSRRLAAASSSLGIRNTRESAAQRRFHDWLRGQQGEWV